MSDGATALERSMRAVTAIRQVMHAIWALSRAQLPLVEHAASAAVVYEQWVDRIVDRVAGPPLAAPAGHVLTVVFGPERAYSSALGRRIVEELPREGELGLVGQRMAELVEAFPEHDRRVRFRCAGSVAHDDLHEVAAEVARNLLEHAGHAQIELLHPAEGQIELQRVVLIASRASTLQTPPESYSPLERVLEAVTFEAMTGRLAVAAVEALRAEIRARIAAADAARKACEERLAELESAWHLGRRETITRELLEIVSGREAALLA